MDQVEALRIANGDASIPQGWYDLLGGSEVDKTLWKSREFLREL